MSSDDDAMNFGTMVVHTGGDEEAKKILEDVVADGGFQNEEWEERIIKFEKGEGDQDMFQGIELL